MLEPSPAFADAALEEIAFYRSFEQFFGYGDEYAATFFPVVGKTDITDRTGIAMLSMGEKSFDALLAAQSFLFRKSIRGVPVHFSSWKGKVRALLQQMEPLR